jgi:hypothetical protein
VGLIADLDTEAREKILFLRWGLNPGRLVILSVVRHYTDVVPQLPYAFTSCVKNRDNFTFIFSKEFNRNCRKCKPFLS